MILMPPNLREQLRANDLARAEALRREAPAPDPVPVVRFFNPLGAATWIATEIDADDAQEMARAGAFLSIESDGSLCIERGYVRPEDEPPAEVSGEDADGAIIGAEGADDEKAARASVPAGANVVPINAASGADEEEDGEILKPLPDRLVAELTAWRTLALQDAFAQCPSTAFAAVLHAFVLSSFYSSSRESCMEVSLNKISFGFAPSDLRSSAPAKAIEQRHKRWADRLPDDDKHLWDALLQFDGAEQAALFAHCASQALNAQAEVVPKYDNGRISRHSVERRIAHSHVLARTVGLDLIGAGWRPTVEGYFRSVTKPRILADVAEAKGAKFAEMIDHLKKGDMATEAERLLEDTAWLPEPMRTPALPDASVADPAVDEGAAELPAFLGENEPPVDTSDHDGEAAAAAA